MKRSPSPKRLILVLCAIMLGVAVLAAQMVILNGLPTVAASLQEGANRLWERAHEALAHLSSAVESTGLDAAWEQTRARVPSALAAPSPEDEVQAAWQRAQEAGAYRFTTRIVQTTHPAPSIANAGRGSRVETLFLDGDADLPAQTLLMRMWQNGGSITNPADAVEIRIEGEQAYGRASGGAWQEMDNFSGGFAPGNDSMAYLVGAKNIREISTETYSQLTIERYAFTLNGPALAEHIRAQLEDHLRQNGELPPGLRLSTPDQFRDAVGDGEVWVDSDGLPRRLTIHMEYPQQRGGERVEAEIYTDFSNFNREAIAQAETGKLGIGKWASNLQSKAREPQTLLSISFLGLLLLTLTHSRSKKIYAAIVIVVIVSMVVTPLLQGAQVYAFHQKQAEQQAQYEAEQAQQESQRTLEAELSESTWDPHKAPGNWETGELVNWETGNQSTNLPTYQSTNSQSLAANGTSSSTDDNDGDGLSNDDDPCPDDADCDDDGLTDGQEKRLGTDPEHKDSDGDLITDNAEVRGFYYDSQWWYSDPLSADTNGDGQLDTIECEAKVVDVEAGEISPEEDTLCADTDSDGTPDLFDRDDDGDGVPDLIDLSPYNVEDNDGNYFDQNHPLLLTIDGLNAGEPAFVDFQVRPENEDHLWHALNVLDWPGNDEEGQIQRKKGNNSTFEDVAAAGQAVAANASNGDMRLIPMLEIEMTGDVIPLQFTNPEIEVGFSGAISATIHFEQNNNNIDLDFSIESGGTYEVSINESPCKDLDDSLYTFTGVTDGAARSISGQNLTDLANGEHGLVLTGDSDEYCLNIGNVVNGPFADQMVDRSFLDPYGISVREKNEDGTLLAYAPLNVVADENEAGRVALSGRMHYWPTAAQWGDTQKVNVVWVIQMLTDHKCNGEEDFAGSCTEDEWVLDTLQIVRGYPETWYLTGMSVREDHGVDIAITYEDPAQESEGDRQYDDWLWTLAWGLDKSFLTGRDEDEDGALDITIAEIHARWDYPTNQNNGYADGDDELWGVPVTATQVVTFAYEIEDEYVKIAMTETEKILDDAFLPYVEAGSEAPTLLFTQESHYRAASLGSEATTSEAVSGTVKITIELDPEKSKEETVATMSWASYRYEDGEWESYPIDEYWDRMEVHYKEVFTEYHEDPEYEDIRRGQVFIAQTFYLSMYRGNSALVQIGSDLVGYHDAAYTDADLEEWLEGITGASGFMARVIKAHTGVLKPFFEFKWGTEFKDTRDFLSRVRDEPLFQRDRDNLNQKYMKAGRAALITYTMMALYYIAGKYGIEPLTHTLNFINLGFTLQGIYGLVQGIADKVEDGMSWLKASAGSSKWTGFTSIGFLLGTAISWGMFAHNFFSSGIKPGSMAGNFALATQIASTITAVILIMISMIPVIGQVLAAVIGLIEAFVLLICGLNPPEEGQDPNPVCFRLSGWIAYGITWAIYAGNIMVDMENEDRLDLRDFSQDFLDPDMGMSVGNDLVYEAALRNQIELIDWKDTNSSFLAGSYWWQYNEDNLRSSSFVYNLEAYGDEHHADLERYLIPHENWDPNSDSADSYAYDDDLSTNIPIEAAGINRGISLYLNESFAIPAQECWLLPTLIPFFMLIPVCYIRTEKGTVNINLGENLRYDVFPATLDGFYTLAARGGGYALAWSQDTNPAFPRLKDADGDGLRVKAAGGSDPDDSKWDTDGDLLSDYFETEIGSNPSLKDSDGDGLSDYDEVTHGTDVNRADTDYDGLTDKEEVDGWEFVYDFAADGSQLSTWVTSDPLTIDGDNDTLSDFQEKVYGLHPRVASDPNVLTLETEVTELKAPHLLLRLDETENVSAFSDQSGHHNNGECQTSHCPASGHRGKYLNAPYFDGSGYIAADGVAATLNGGAITFGGWAKPEAGMTENGALFAFNTASGGNRNMLLSNKTTRQFFHYDGASAISANAFALDEWHHVMVVIDENDNGVLYVNGTQEATFTSSVRPAADGKFSIGQEWDGSTATNFFKGYLDEVVVIPAALSQAEVQELAAGRYNPEDLTLRPNESLYYEATVENELYNRYAEGLLSTDFPTTFSELDPQDFVLNPKESVTISGIVDVGSAASGVYTLTQQADALITDWSENSNDAEALYRFSDTDTFLEDHSGSHPPRDGECNGHCPTLAAGRYGNGAAFDGSSQYITADGVSDDLANADNISFGGWVYPESGMSANGVMLSFHTSGGGNRLMLEYDPVGANANKFIAYDKTNGDVYSANTFIPDQWYHVMVVIGADNAGYLYVNGVEEAQFSTTVRPATDGKFSLGQEWDGSTPSNFFKGRLDEIVVYRKALSYQEVQELYNNPVFHLPFDERSGATSFEDDSGLDNDGTCQGDSCPAAGEEGLSINAAAFDGGDYVNVPDSDALDLSNSDFTFSTWVYPEETLAKHSDCPFVAEYFSNEVLHANRETTRRCEDYPIDHNWGTGSPPGVFDDHFSARWTGTFYFKAGWYTFDFAFDDAIRIWIDDSMIYDGWNYWPGWHHSSRQRHLSAGEHTIKIEYREEAGNAEVKVTWDPESLYAPEGIWGGDDYPAIQRVRRRLRLIFGDKTFQTGNVLDLNDWNHIALAFDDDNDNLILYVDSVEIGQYSVLGESAGSGQGFNIGRAAHTAELDLQTLSVLDTQEWDGAELRIDLQLDGGDWEEVWAQDGIFPPEDYALNEQRSFAENAVIKVYETDAGECEFGTCPDNQMGTHTLNALQIPPYETATRFERGYDVADLLYTVDNAGAPFRGRIDEVALYKRLLDAGQVADLYEAGTLALHWPLDDPPGTSDFRDTAGQNNGACSGDQCPIAGVQGRDGMALLFDGANDTIAVSDANTADIQNLTVAAWVRLNSLPNPGIMRFVTVGDEKAVLRYQDGDLHFYIKSTGGTFYSLRPGASLSANDWFHVAGTYDGSTMRLYLDGSEIMTKTVAATLTGGDTVRLSSTGETLDGYLDDVRVYRQALSAAQIQNLYQDAPEMLLLLDETVNAAQFLDFTDNGHDGTCAGDDCPGAGIRGQMGLAALFDGADDYLEIPHDDALNPDDEMTLALWVKLDDVDPHQKLIGKTNSTPNRGYVLGVLDGQLFPEVWKTNGGKVSGQWGEIAAGIWTHLAFTWKKNGELVGYINGIEVGSAGGGSRAIGSSTNPLRIGVAPWNTGLYPANGRLDHVSLYNRALSASEIREMFRLQAKWVEDRYHTEIKIDNDEPTSTLETDETYRRNQDALLVVKAEDTSTGVVMMEMGLSVDGGGSYTWEAAPECDTSQKGAAWCPTFEPIIGEGKYLLQFRATDLVGNRESGPVIYTIFVDDTPPTAGTGLTNGQILGPDLQADNSWLLTISGTASDPDIGPDPGSGVGEVVVDLDAADTVTDTLGPAWATVGAGTWQVAYPFLEPDPTGTYTVSIDVADNVSHTVEIDPLVTIGVDAAPPVASLDDVTAKVGVSGTITTTLQLTGQITETGVISIGVSGVRLGFIPAAMESLSNTLGIFHLDEPGGATQFENITSLGDATCEGAACPEAGQPGMWGNAVKFDGNDYLSADDIPANITDTHGFAFGAWVYPTSPFGTILAFEEADGTDRNKIRTSGGFVYEDSNGSVFVIGGAEDQWNHIVVSIDADGNGTVYLDGQPVQTFETDVRPDPDGRFTIGYDHGGDGNDYFRGLIDEVVAYDRSLPASEVYALYAEADLAASGQGVIQSTWAYTIPATLDGLYQINLLPRDLFTNTAPRSEWWAWTGEIDTRGPEVDLEIVEESEKIGSAGNAEIYNATTTYTCWARDFNLILSSNKDSSLNFDCPCQTVAPVSTAITNTFYHEVSPWYAGVFTDTARLYETVQTCTVLGLSPAPNFMKACDAYGHCTNGQDDDVEEAYAEIPRTYSNILTPTHNTIITSTASFNIEGKSYSYDRLEKVEVKRYPGPTTIGIPVTNICATDNITMTEWTQTWNPSDGIHKLFSVATPCSGTPYTEYYHEVYVDTIPPAVSFTRTSLNRQQRISFGRVSLTGAVSDATSGAAKVEVSVDGGDWAPASIQGDRWRYEWALGEEPDNAQYTVTVRATDRAGWTRQITQGVTVDLDVPNPITITVSSNAVTLTQGDILTTTLATIDLNWEASEPSEKLSHYEVRWTIRTTDTIQITTIVLPTQPLSSTYPAGEAQRVDVQVTSVFTDGNKQVDNWGPVYVDSLLTPDYIHISSRQLPYHGWMDSGCTNLGLDRRVFESAQGGAALDDPQNLYVTWDSEGLRIAWLGANWDYNGDLFIYLDDFTDPSVPLTAYNPFTGTLGIDINIPGGKAFIWVKDSKDATLYVWDGNIFNSVQLARDNSPYYRFDPGLNGGHTDLYIPFSMIGISNPATRPLSLFAFATEEDEMSLWAAMPPQNLVNSPRVVETTLYAGASQVLEWAHTYAWLNLGPGTCPNNSASPLQGYLDADLRFGLSATPDGTTYGLMSNDLFWMAEDLTDLDREPDFSQHFAFMDVDHPPVGDGDTITYTLSFENHGTYTATGVIMEANALYALQFSGTSTRTITATIGTIAPGESGSINFSGYVDTSAPHNFCLMDGGSGDSCAPYKDWAVLNAQLFDSAHGIGGGQPLDWLWADHEVDSDPPEFFGILSPDYIIGAGNTTFKGYAFDASGVPTLTLEADPPLGGSHQTECLDDSPYNGVWSCDWNATTANGGSVPNDGDTFQIRLQATDSHGQSSAWSDEYTYIVDTVAPTVTLSAKTTETYSGTVENLTAASFSGSAGDNHGLGGVEVCVDGDCNDANLQMTGASAYSDADEPTSAISITACSGGGIVRTFAITESFTLGGVALGFNADHPRRDELQVTLESPSGVTVTVIAPPEGTFSEFENFDLLLADAATNGLHDFKANDDTAEPYFERLSRPEDPLDDFYGENSNGAWTLTICDTDDNAESGSYNRARLVLEKQNSAVTHADWSYTLIGLDDQDYISHTLTAHALDLAGNRSTDGVTLTFQIDNVAPTITVSETVEVTATGANPVSVQVMAGTSSDGGEVQTLYAMATTPSGDRISLQIGRDGDDWWLEFTPEETGEYTFWINAVDLAGNVTTAGRYTVTIIWVVATHDGPTALGETTTFTATVLGDDEASYTYDWDYGNGTVVSDQYSVISTTYAAADTYTVTVTAKKGTDAFTGTTVVLVDEAITGLTASDDSPTMIEEVTTLTGTLSTGTNVAYHWDFGDGQPSAVDDQAVASHMYPGGSFTATITAANSVSVMTATVQVAVTSLTVVNDSPTYLGNATIFTATVTTSDPVTYTWNFGDQPTLITNQLSVISHTYAAFGVFTTTVRADTSTGVITETSRVQVVGMEVVNDSPTLLDNATNFTVTIEMDEPITYTWDFGDSSPLITDTSTVISHTYGVAGFYTATITATNGALTVTNTTTATVDEAIADLTLVNDSPTVLGRATTLTVTISAGSNVTYQWDFGDGSPVISDPLSVISYTYPAGGVYTAIVTASNSVSVVTATTTVTVTTTDTDEDGVDGGVEDGAPNNGDGNNDGVPDSQQNNVASLPNAVDGRYVTLVSPDGRPLGNVQALENMPEDPPAGVESPIGFFGFRVRGLVVGGTTTVTLLLPPGVTVETYYKYGPTLDDPTPHWYEFLFDGTTGAEILTDEVILHFVDGQRGDSDLVVNGEILDPGTPALCGVDLTTAFVSAEPGDSVDLTARVSNNGSVQVPAGLPVAFYLGDPANGGTLINTADTTSPLNPGDFEDVTVTWNNDTPGDHTIFIVANEGNPLNMCGAQPTVQQAVSILDVPLVESWNLMSAYVNPFNTDASVVQRPIEGQYVVIQGFDGGARSYYPDLPPGVNTLKDMDALHGYWIKAKPGGGGGGMTAHSAADVVATLRVVGQKLAEDQAIELAANWNLVGYLPRQPLAVANALQSIDGLYTVVLGYDQGALSYYPDIDPSFNTLITMEPLFGYWIKMTETDTLIYPATAGQVSDIGDSQYPIANIRQAERAAGVTPTHNWVNFYGTADASDGTPLPVGTTVLAIDSDGVVCGATLITTEGRYGLLACYGDDPTTSGDEGARPGDTIQLVVDGEVIGRGMWTEHGGRQWRSLGKVDLWQVYLPLIRKGS